METYLTIKHLAPYLPYNLQVFCENSTQTILDLVCLSKTTAWLAYKSGNDYGFDFDEFKPILRPLSDYLEINSEAMILLNCDLPEQIQICDLANKRLLLSEISVSAYVICLENHIDVNRLIPARLAIDINTLSK